MTTTHEQTTRHDPRTRPRTTTRDEDQHQPTKTPRTNQDTKERPGPDYITTTGPRQQPDQRTTTNHEDETTNHEDETTNHETTKPREQPRANAGPHYQKLYARVNHIRGNRRSQPSRSAMKGPHPERTS